VFYPEQAWLGKSIPRCFDRNRIQTILPGWLWFVFALSM